jgi:hypothetical protein
MRIEDVLVPLTKMEKRIKKNGGRGGEAPAHPMVGHFAG